MNTFQPNTRAASNYAPQIYPGRITLFKAELSVGDEEPESQQEGAQTLEEMELADPTRGWANLSTLPVEVYTVSGTHPTMIVEPYVRDLAHQLRSCLDAYQLAVR